MIEERPLNALEVADILHVGKNKVYALARSGELASYRIGRKLRFSMRDVEAYLRSQRSDAFEAPELAERRDDVAAAAELLQRPASGVNAVFSGSGFAADLLAHYLTSAGICLERRVTNAFSALVSLYARKTDLAVANLYDARANRYNTPFVRRLAPGTPVVVVRLASRKVGFIVNEGNRKKIASWGALFRPDIRLVNYPKGTGERILLDEKIVSMGGRPESVRGYGREAQYPQELVARIKSGEGDVCIGPVQLAQDIDGLEFVALQDEDIDVVVLKNDRNKALVRAVKDIAASEAFGQALRASGGYDTSKTGAIVYES